MYTHFAVIAQVAVLCRETAGRKAHRGRRGAMHSWAGATGKRRRAAGAGRHRPMRSCARVREESSSTSDGSPGARRGGGLVEGRRREGGGSASGSAPCGTQHREPRHVWRPRPLLLSHATGRFVIDEQVVPRIGFAPASRCCSQPSQPLLRAAGSMSNRFARQAQRRGTISIILMI